jgi:AmmeMemoRadiSam system protein B
MADGVRPSAIAGRWYPGNAGALRREVEGFLAQVAPVELPGPLLGLVVPHAGYAYSGPTAARAFAQVRGSGFKRVVLLGPLHRPIWGSQLGSFMAPDATAYRTPLGDVPIDCEFLQALDARVGLTTVHGDEEHALEIELPFLQMALDDFSLVPIMMGDHIADAHAAERAGRLAAALAGRLKIEDGKSKIGTGETLLVASTDLSHLEDYGAVRRTDERLVDLVNAFDVDGLREALVRGTVQACGAMGLVTVLEACRLLGARGASVLEYTTSGDVTGQRAPGVYTVGYLAAAIYG